MSTVDFDMLRRVAADLNTLGMKKSSARILAAIEVAPDERMAPVQDDRKAIVPMRAIPWGLHEMMWRIYSDNGHGQQSAERLAERGGFSRAEIGGLAVGLYIGAAGRTIPLLDLYREAKGME